MYSMNNSMIEKKNCMKSIIAAVAVSVLLLTACGKSDPDGDRFDNKLRETWISNDPSVYSGKVVIEYNKITIYDYFESQTPPINGDDSQRPFRDFPKGMSLSGYSEGDVIYINNVGKWHEIPFTYWEQSYPRTKLLRIDFGGRTETLMPGN
jgi:hypothetical protein